MQRIVLFIMILVVAISCKQEANTKFDVSGEIQNAHAQKIYLVERTLGSTQPIIVDSSNIFSDGSFHLKTIPKEESLYYIYLKEGERYVANVINDGASVKVNIDLNKSDFSVEGSPATSSLQQFLHEADNKWAEANKLRDQLNELQKSGGSDSMIFAINAEGDRRVAELKNYVDLFLKNSQSPVASLFVLNEVGGLYTDEENQALINKMAEKFPEHKGVQALKEMYDNRMAALKKRREAQKIEWVGKQAPEISLPDVNGKEITLSSFRGKFVLVDFWASWCRPCRGENPNVVKAYNQFRDKNFTILGVSLDSEKDKWLEAIQQDNLTWTHVSDLKEWDSEVVPVFGFAETGIPFNVLVDPSGKIIAQGLRGDALEKKLAEVLK